MARHKRADWPLPAQVENWEQVAVAVLMDIRDELQTIRALAQCGRIPRALDAVARLDKRMAKKVKLP